MTTPPSLGSAETPAVQWPDRLHPDHASVVVANQVVIAAPVEQVWPWLLRAELWPEWYPHASEVHFVSHTGPDLRNRSRLRWKTAGLTFTSKVLEFEPMRRLAMDAHAIGVDAYLVWVLEPLAGGETRVTLQETQTGWLARLNQTLMPRRTESMHRVWLENLRRQVTTGDPRGRGPGTV